MLAHAFRGGARFPLTFLFALVRSACILLGIQKKDRKTDGSKTQKNVKMSLPGSKKASKIEPKVISGRGFFDFGQSLISCNTTRVLLDFHGFRLPRGGQKTIKKRFRKKSSKKVGPKSIFYKKMRKWSSKWTPFWITNSPPIPPRGVIIPTWGPRAPKRSPRVPKGCQKTEKVPKEEPKGYQKGAKREPKRYENYI